ncbi:hypothetical protein [Paraburkholderia elongata]|uniref:Uncharacterized protein n=1 Tax=Paraburkholderia elongata TaxID=2675747 RepID=A0A972NVC0_9BURK|nr:hypothetical protein [Paraburkholderia elongata]NPT59059.1 hypothetical protein [Paraburkholderia elongata]
MGEENNASALIVPLEVVREARRKIIPAKQNVVPVESEQCRQCRMKVRRLAEFIYLAAEVADEF